VPLNVRDLLADLALEELSASSPDFWFKVAGLGAFLTESGVGLLRNSRGSDCLHGRYWLSSIERSRFD
jgi:hypothetical protein